MAEETKDVSPSPEKEQDSNEEMDTEDQAVEQEENEKDNNDKQATPKKEEKANDVKQATPKKKEKADDDGDEDDEDEEESDEEELQAGLLERPVVIEDGRKRERKKVERMTFQSPETDEKKIEEGKGTKLGDIPFVEHKINITKSEDLKPLHRILFRRQGAVSTLKKSLRKFSGFPFPKSDSEYEKRVQIMKSNKFTVAMLKKVLDVFNLPKHGTKDEMIDRLMSWLLNPEDTGKKVPQKRKRSKKGQGKEKKEKKKTKKTKTKKSKATAEDDDDDDDDDDNDDDEADEKEKDDEEGSEEEKEESEDDNEDSEESEDEEEPPKKKAKKVSPKATPKPKKQREKPTPKAKVTPKKKVTPVKKKKVASDDEVSDISSDSDDDVPLKTTVKSKGPPTNEEIKDFVKKMLENADLETVTMKTVLKDVYAKYPTFDLSDRKNFIKDTVKQIIS